MKPPPFEYLRATSIDQAVALLKEYGDEAKILAGGQSLVPMLNLRLSRPTALIDLNPAGLESVTVDDNSLHLDALVRHRTLERNATIARLAPLLTLAAPLIGHPPIRTRGTIGGSVAHADPAAELPAVLVAVDATFLATSSQGTRKIPASEMFVGPFMTALGDDEVLARVDVPPHSSYRCAYEELAVRAGDFAVTSVAVMLRLDAEGRVDDARIVLSGVAGVPIRASEAEDSLRGTTPNPGTIREAGSLASAATSPFSDVHGSAKYRRHLADVLTCRALAKLWGDQDRKSA